MDAYEVFAKTYDTFMEEVDYPSWIAHLEAIWKRFDVQPEMICDLGCGTGNVAIPLLQKGYAVMGVDNSEEMLTQARKKAMDLELQLPLFCQDMVELDLPMYVDCMISLCDCLNYLTEDGELLEAFQGIKENLCENGWFIFDMNTPYKFKHVLGNQTYAATTEDAAYFWENTFDEEENINEYYVSFFSKQEGRETYERAEEYHYERAYSLEEIQGALTEAGFTVKGLYDGYSFAPIKEDSERFVFVVQVV
ncbi:class I SAM-dependent methyltransferase [Chakrabartyella piscis]|uniref:class I SAM-dependent DNA methyltransferase n=1 Tax=Chakrabartyella piscis TaxID=2918914 RepID=UPI0029586055|nr:class I SAM-dependent methyltransferase [Chakrabartyella piscis]